MLHGIITAAVSAVILVTLLVLYRIEEGKGHRIVLLRVREFLDRIVFRLGSGISRFFAHIGAGAFQATFHYLIHRLLSRIIRLLTSLESYLSRLQLRNKRIATVMREGGRRTHLDEIASHKEQTSLSEEERRQRRKH